MDIVALLNRFYRFVRGRSALRLGFLARSSWRTNFSLCPPRSDLLSIASFKLPVRFVKENSMENVKGSPTAVKKSPKSVKESGQGMESVKASPKSVKGSPMDRKEIVKESPSEKLLNSVLEDGGDMDTYSEALEIFNPRFCLSSALLRLKDLLADEMVQFENAVDGHCFQLGDISYCHLTDFTKIPTEKAKISKRFGRFSKKSSFCPPINIACQVHKKPCT
ncbi:hypothetical protein L7F22_020327 [Adiantum nelumboides]|nr:hypothetical protein [Adiantum nelumboides]